MVLENLRRERGQEQGSEGRLGGWSRRQERRAWGDEGEVVSESRPMCGLEAEEEHAAEAVHSAEPLGLSLPTDVTKAGRERGQG